MSSPCPAQGSVGHKAGSSVVIRCGGDPALAFTAPHPRSPFRSGRVLGPGSAVSGGLRPAILLSAEPLGLVGRGPRPDAEQMSCGLFEVKSVFSNVCFTCSREGCGAGVCSELPLH